MADNSERYLTTLMPIHLQITNLFDFFMVMTGASTPLVQSQLGHKSLVAAAIYQRANSTPVKAAADEAIKVMQHYAEKQTIKKLTKKISTSSKNKHRI